MKIIFLLLFSTVTGYAQTDSQNVTYWNGTCLDTEFASGAAAAEYGLRANEILGSGQSLSATVIENWLNGRSLVSVRRIPAPRNYMGRINGSSKCSYTFSKIGNEPTQKLNKEVLQSKVKQMSEEYLRQRVQLIKWKVYQCRDEFNFAHNHPYNNRTITQILEDGYRMAATITSEIDETQCLYIFVRNF